MKAWLARSAYSLLLRALTPAYLLKLWWRGRREPLYRYALAQRLGFGYAAADAPLLWLHAVSLGETRAAAALIDALRRADPSLRLLLTHGTATGLHAGRALLRDGDKQTWLPWDTPGAVRRFFGHYRISTGVLMETEIWPNLLRGAAAAGVPMVLANARLSEKSLAKARRLDVLMRPMAELVIKVLAQTEADARRLRDAGARDALVCGNLKFDVTPDAQLLTRGAQWRQALSRPVVLAAVTREGEEQPLLQCWSALPQPRPLLLLVPRHPQRFDEVAALVAAAGLSLARRSQWHEQPPAEAANADVWLGDSMGEMPLYYASADVALLGGSFARLGGQNLIEAAACGCPVVMGPHTFNFSEAAELSLQAGAGLRVPDIAAGVQRAVALSHDPARERYVQSALAFAAAHRGAATRMAAQILSCAKAQPGG